MQSILAVDDSPSMRKMVSFTLTGAGYNVVEAVDGQDALEKAESHNIDLVLADQQCLVFVRSRRGALPPTARRRGTRITPVTPTNSVTIRPSTPR